MAEPLDVADKITQLVADALVPLERTINRWPAEFREIIWHAVVVTAQQRQRDAIAEKSGS